MNRAEIDTIKRNLKTLIWFARLQQEDPSEVFKRKLDFLSNDEHDIQKEIFEYLIETEVEWKHQLEKR